MDTDRAQFFAQEMYAVNVSGWPRDQLQPARPVTAPAGADLRLWAIDPQDRRPLPDADPARRPASRSSTTFSLVNSGNRTKYAPKRSWKIKLAPGHDDDRVAGMRRLNLKSMYNDPSQQREALAWWLFGGADLPAPRHTYARLAIDGNYLGLFSVIEEVDEPFLADRFGQARRGNLYKAGCGALGCATLEYRADQRYDTPGHGDPTYRLTTNEDDASANGYDDLAALIRAVNGIGLPASSRPFDTDAFRQSVERVFDVHGFLRWAAVNVLLGSWDNYFATPANYYLYNGGQPGRPRDFVADPYFTFIPWDYDNCLGIDYVGTPWQYTDLLDWPSNTERYGRGQRSQIPLVQNLLAHHDLAREYLDNVERLLDTVFDTTSICARMGTPDGEGLWQRVRQSAYLESDSPFGRPFTGRQFSNDEVYRAGFCQDELHHDNAAVLGIYHYVRMRYDSARAQLDRLRAGAAHPAHLVGAGGA